MALFSDLDDDRVLEVLDWLRPEEIFKLLRVNRRFNRLAAEKLRDKVKAIQFTELDSPSVSKCAHLDTITQDQVLILGAKFRNLHEPSARAYFSSVLTKCIGLKSISFGDFKYPSDIFIEAFQRCLELDCLKFNLPDVEISEWEHVFNQIGQRIVHLNVARSGFLMLTPIDAKVTLSQKDARFIELVAAKCVNIKQVDVSLDWFSAFPLTSDLVSALKTLPKSCWVELSCFDIKNHVVGQVFEDVVDDLDVEVLNLSALGQRVERLSKLRFYKLDRSVSEVDFIRLKKLDFTHPFCLKDDVNCLATSQFPNLEEFGLNAVGLTEKDYDVLFRKTPSVKKLSFIYDLEYGRDSNLPQPAVHLLKNLETIEVKIWQVSRNWKPEVFIQQLEMYVDEIISLKKLSVDTKGLGGKRKDPVESEIKRLKLKLEQLQSQPNRLPIKDLFVSTPSMVKLEILDDDCLLQVLERLPPEELFKMLRVNKRMNRLAIVKLQVKIQAIRLWETHIDDPRCFHLGSINQDQVFFMGPMFGKDISVASKEPSKRASLLNVLTKCSGVKSIEFSCFKLPEDFLLEVFRRCPEIECIKLKSDVEEDVWEHVMNEIGQKIVHIGKEMHFDEQKEIRLLQTIISKCNNIKQVDWSINRSSITTLLASLKMLPKTCCIKLNCEHIKEQGTGEVFEVVDDLRVGELDWSLLGDRIDRLSSLTFRQAEGPVHGVDFANLKKLDFQGISILSNTFTYLLACQFPLLEEFYFDASAGFKEADYEVLFSRMASLKKLTMIYLVTDDNMIYFMDPHLPRASIRRLNCLETIVLNVECVPGELQNFVQPLKEYVNGISSLKKLIVDLRGLSDDCNDWAESVEEEVERMKMKQNRVKIDLIL